MAYTIVYSPEATQDLLHIYNYIAAHSTPHVAQVYTDRIASTCDTLSIFPERGTRHDDIYPGIRTAGFEGRITIAFHVTKSTVIIDRILYAGRDINIAFE